MLQMNMFDMDLGYANDEDFLNPHNLLFPPEILDAFKNKNPTVLLSISGGKDSNAMVFTVVDTIKQNNWNCAIELIHADLGAAEHPMTANYIEEFRRYVDLPLNIALRYTLEGKRQDLVEQIEERAKSDKIPFPDSNNQWCTSDNKRGPLDRLVTPHEGIVIMAMGMRAEESTRRSKMACCRIRPSKKPTKKRTTYDWLPLHNYTEINVWNVINQFGGHYHPMYKKEETHTGLGNNRLSCALCILADKNDLKNGAYSNPETYRRYCKVELDTGFTFRKGFWLCSVAPELLDDNDQKRYQEVIKNDI